MDEKFNSEGLFKELSDEELVMKCLNGEINAFGHLVGRYRPQIYAFISRRAYDQNLAEDLTQDSFIEAYNSFRTCQNKAKFSNWLFGIARNRYRKWAAERKHPVSLDTLGEQVDESIEKEIDQLNQNVCKIENVLNALSNEEKRVLILKHRGEKTCEEIASILKKPVGTIKSQLSRLYKKLRSDKNIFI